MPISGGLEALNLKTLLLYIQFTYTEGFQAQVGIVNTKHTQKDSVGKIEFKGGLGLLNPLK